MNEWMNEWMNEIKFDSSQVSTFIALGLIEIWFFPVSSIFSYNRNISLLFFSIPMKICW